MNDLNNVFNQTLKIVKECGNILEEVDYEKEIKIKEDGSLVTKYDLMLDAILSKKLKEIKNIPVLSEEHYEELGDTYFVIDPIDGTHNFSRGLEYFGIMVALVEKNQTVFSIVELPLLNKTYTAIKGQGAFLNGNKITVREIGERFIGNTTMQTDEMIHWITKLNKSAYKFEFRSWYCACVPLCYIASGNIDFNIHYGAMGIWDTLVPQLILEEAGGVCEVTKYNDNTYKVIAGSKEAVSVIKGIISNK